MKNFSAKRFLKVFSITFIFAAFQFFGSLSADANTHKQSLQLADNAIKSIFDNMSLQKSSQSVWYPVYHFASPGYEILGPNALTDFNGSYHLFYKHKVKTQDGEKVVWGHSSSPDFIHWKNLNTALAPSENYDKDGVTGGSAIVGDGLLYLFYTGNSKITQGEKTEEHQTQNLAMSKDGINFGKSANNPVIKMAPHYSYLEFSSQKFKDPYVWKLEDRYYALVGTQYLKTKDGAVLLFKSKDLRNWVCINVTALGQNLEMGDFWENPSLVHIDGNDVLSLSTTGIKPHGKMYLNKYQSGAFVGKLDYNTGKFAQKGAFMLYDYGFDFLAPKFTKTLDGRNIFVAYLGMDSSLVPEKAEGWSGIFTLPRELKIINGKIKTYPIKELESLRSGKISIPAQSILGEKEFPNIKGDAYELTGCFDLVNAKSFAIKLRTSSSQETILSYDKNTHSLKLDRNKSGQSLQGEREVTVPLVDNKLKLRIFVDTSSVEIFVNDGEAAISSRIYPDKNAVGVKFFSDGETKIEQLDFYKLKSVYN